MSAHVVAIWCRIARTSAPAALCQAGPLFHHFGETLPSIGDGTPNVIPGHDLSSSVVVRWPADAAISRGRRSPNTLFVNTLGQVLDLSPQWGPGRCRSVRTGEWRGKIMRIPTEDVRFPATLTKLPILARRLRFSSSDSGSYPFTQKGRASGHPKRT